MTSRIDWPDVRRHFLQVMVFCALVAVLTSVIWQRDSYWAQLGKASTIGLICWAVIEFGRYLIDPRHCHRVREGQHGWPKGWRGLLLAGFGIACGYLVGTPLGDRVFGGSGNPTVRDGQLGLLITIAAGTMATLYYYLSSKAEALEASRNAAERDASEARLKLLQSQLEPHMLFNTLANLRALIGIDPAAAQQMLDQLNDYLRATLSASRATQHPLSAEFERLRDYLALMAIRMGPRLQVELQLPEALRATPVPPLILQPLVENAIQHGLEPRVGGGRLTVTAAREGEALVLTVQDGGVGFEPAQAAAREGSFGLAQVHERVASAYGGRGQVELQSRPGEGTTVRLRLPAAAATP